ncbi:tyrosine-type recombinase/integrase [Calothrix membranacea FACHB-236]|nr:tyrosine-type recombinase/integrase [Calothrix membranacea FACHB-236]
MEALNIQWSPSKLQALENQVIGFWTKDKWDVAECPLIDKKAVSNRSKYVFFNCIYSSINTELKYACWQKLENNSWSTSSFWIQGSRIKKITSWLNEVIKNEKSLIDKNLEYWILSLRSYLVDRQLLREYTSERLGRDQKLKNVLVQDPTIILLRQIYKVIADFYDDRDEYDKTVWDLRKLGIEIDKTKSGYNLNFEHITQPWLLQATKKFIRYTLSILSQGECINRISTLKDFSAFISHYHPSLKPEDIDRPIILEYITQLPATGLASGTRHRQIGCLRTFLELCAREGWANVPDKRLIYNEDFPRISKGLPRYIPEEVMSQLNKHIEDLPPHIMRMTLVLQECGMRIGELCQLPFNCLNQDIHGDWFLLYYQSKMKKEHIIPISKECALVIQEQQNIILEEWGFDFPYLFPTPKSYGKGNPMKQKPFTDALNKLAFDKNICDINGKLWRFQAHQFRHTVGTRMANNGVPHHIIQRYLGHQSPEMTTRYAYIHDQTLKEEFAKFKGKVVDVIGRVVESEDTQSNSADLQWIKKNILTQALPNGTCALPVIAGSCPHANACLTCTHFRTTTVFLDDHKKQLEQTKRIIETAKANGWQRQVEMNEKVQENLERIIASLEVKEDDA